MKPVTETSARPTKGEETYARILDRALRMASRDGLEGLSIGALAKELGLSKSGLFGHFGSKEDLQVELLRAAVERFRVAVVLPALAAKRGEPRVRAFLDRWLAWGNDPSMPGGCIFVAAAIELDDRPGPARDFLVGSQREWLQAVATSARLAIEAGDFRPDLDTEQFAFEAYAIALGFNHANRLMRDPKAGARARAAGDRLIASARRPPASK